ncbi:hypothetical protein UYO_0355 [Lachnospiraceae bacterium JC7]|nr:hypothetical protein UYO_0355 [Lachnospiraceae bacterium JC7]
MRNKAALAMTVFVIAFGMIGCQKSQKNADATEAATTEAVSTAEETTTAPAETEETTVESTEETGEEESKDAEIDYPTLPLPEFHYYGPEDWADYADGVCHFLVENSFGDVGSDLTICVPNVLKVDDSDPKDVKLWGDYVIHRYLLANTSLIDGSGSSFGGIAHIDASEGGPMVTDFEFLEDGSGFDASLDKLFGSVGLKAAYLDACINRDKYLSETLANYINNNGLYITQYQEYGWAPVPVLNAPPTREEDQQIHYAGNFAYTAQFDMREICAHEMDGADIFTNVNSDDWNDFLMEIYSRNGSDMDSAVSELKSNLFDENAILVRTDDVTFKDIEGCTSLVSDGPYKDGEHVYVNYFVPRNDDIFVIKISTSYCADEKKQMATDSIIEEFLGGMELE